MHMKTKALLILSAVSLSCISNAELVEISDESLSEVSGQNTGLTIDIDVTGVEFQYSYQNNDNPNEDYWVVGKDTGPVVSTVAPGSGASIARISGIDIDIVNFPTGEGGLIVGVPRTVQINKVNTGDYFIADETVAGQPPADADISETTGNRDRKLFGLKWNTPIQFGFTSAGASANSVKNYNFTNDMFHGSGQVIIVAD